ncbi:MAG: threonine synthase [SAR202 cluster bacterium]|nr:threonine synthase [SAR202 cluster bacterium]
MRTLVCSKCGSTLKVEYSDQVPPSGIRLPLHNPSASITLGEGNTPIVELPQSGHITGLDRLFAKLEFANPTGSYKDRGSAVMMSAAVEYGATEIVEDSSGNAGASVSAYAARAGIQAHIFAPESAPPAKLQQISVYGAKLHPVPGPRAAATTSARTFVKEKNLIYLSHTLSPFFTEGIKSFSYEVATQMCNDLPDHVVFPVGNGSLFIGAFKGFEELVKQGRMPRIPRLHIVQSTSVMPVVSAIKNEPWSLDMADHTVAGGISVVDPPHIHRMGPIVEATGGDAVAVSDESIVRWQKILAEKEGVFAEPTSSAAFAGLESLIQRESIGRDDTVLVPVTGFGLKDAPPH